MSEHNPIEDELTAYVDGELSELDMQRVKAALAADPKLAALEQLLRSTVSAVEALPSPQPSQALRRELRAPLVHVTFGSHDCCLSVDRDRLHLLPDRRLAAMTEPAPRRKPRVFSTDDPALVVPAPEAASGPEQEYETPADSPLA